MTVDLRRLFASVLGTAAVTQLLVSVIQLLRTYRLRYVTEGGEAFRETIQHILETAPSLYFRLLVAYLIAFIGSTLILQRISYLKNRSALRAVAWTLVTALASAIVGIEIQLGFFTHAPYPASATDILIVTSIVWGLCGLIASILVQWLLGGSSQ